uniref:Uncharacterized protein n=1 Tax=Hyaloperonospora arabidopsidis (strain Emoy2) TaxID=559515 RepID=M4B309_HYAAE
MVSRVTRITSSRDNYNVDERRVADVGDLQTLLFQAEEKKRLAMEEKVKKESNWTDCSVGSRRRRQKAGGTRVGQLKAVQM